MKISQELYAMGATASRNAMAKAIATTDLKDLMKRAMPKEMGTGGEIPMDKWSLDHPLVKEVGRRLIKAGVTTGLGFNFYDLRGPAYFIFPLLTPFIQMIGSQGKVNAGVGTVAHWKATRNPNSTYVYAGVVEGQRNALATPDEVDYLATYKELGMEGGETFTAQWAGEGYTDNLADEHFRNLARLRLQQEMMTLWGNSGTATGNLGFALGQPPTPTSTLVTATGPLGSGANVVVAVVAITGMGMNPGGQAGYAVPPSVANGLTPSYVRTNADGTQTNVSCGLSAISNVQALVTTNATAQQVKASIAAQKGAVAYAWFWGVNVTAAAGNVKLGAITNNPNVTITNVAAGTYLGNAAGLSTDNSFQPTDFDGLGTYAQKVGLWNDQGGGSFTPDGNGQVAEIETDLQYLWDNYQAQPDAIWCSSDTRRALEKAVVYSSTGTNSFIFNYQSSAQGDGILGGFAVTAYKSKYSINREGGAAIPIRIHPMFPSGTLYYDINTNPYPHSRIPAVRQFLMQRDYYSIEWPVVTRQWTFGTYWHGVLAHYVPWISALRTGIGPFVAPCWLAALAFGEDMGTGIRTEAVRNYLLNWEATSIVGKAVVGTYRVLGQQAATVVGKSKTLTSMAKSLFTRILRKADQQLA